MRVCSGVNLAEILGGRRADPKGLLGVGCGLLGVACGYGVLLPTGEGSEEGLCPLSRKKWFFTLNGVFWYILFCPCLYQKNVEFSTWSGDLVDIEGAPFGNSEYCVRIMGLISFLLHYCIAMQAIWCVKFWNMTKSGRQFALTSAHSKFWGKLVPVPLRDLCPCDCVIYRVKYLFRAVTWPEARFRRNLVKNESMTSRHLPTNQKTAWPLSATISARSLYLTVQHWPGDVQPLDSSSTC